MKKICFITHCCPAPFSNGGAEICWTILNEFKKKYKITLLIVAGEEEYSKSLNKRNILENLCDNILILKSERESNLFDIFKKKPFYFFNPPLDLLLPALKVEKSVKEFLRNKNVDFVFAYDWHVAPCVMNLKIKKILIVGDLLHYPHQVGLLNPKKLGRKRNVTFRSLLKTIGSLWVIVHLKKIQIKIMNKFDNGGSFGFWDANWLKSKGVRFSKYYKTPYFDTSLIRKKNEESLSIKKKFKILTGLGRLHATATGAGLQYLHKYILPILKNKLNENDYEVHILGDGYLNFYTKNILKYKNVFLRGYVKDLHQEIESSDAFLLPTPIFLGYRCRLINSACLSQCMILHKYDVINQPEFIHEKNCMIGDTPESIVENLLRVLNNPNLKKLIKKNARQMYIENFEPGVAMKEIYNEIC